MMALLPSWAPNLHPLVVHFPIALLLVAALADLIDMPFGRPKWLAKAVTTLFALGSAGAVVACLSGQQALDTVLMPGMAHPIVQAHRTWAIATTIYFSLLTVIRVGAAFRAPLALHYRVAFLIAALVGVAGLQQTAERGGRLVYEQGVGVIGSSLR
jgi:uncharacterized membrane protein